MTKNTKTPTPKTARKELRAEMRELCEHLKHELENPDPFANALERQVVVLDRLLYAVMRRALKDDIENGDFNPPTSTRHCASKNNPWTATKRSTQLITCKKS